jgi:hypothetical protein
MNFTDFEHLRQESQQMNLCLNDCIEAERSARLRPMHTLTVTRRAAENLFMEQCKKYDLQFIDLNRGIDSACKCMPRNKDQINRAAHFVRRKGNDDIHPEVGERKLVHAATNVNIDRAFKVLQAMYDLLSLIYGKPAGAGFQEKRIPFDEYEILRKITDHTSIDLKRYFVRGGNGRTYYLQSLSHRKMRELEGRRNEANNRIYENLRRRSRLLLPIPLPVPENSDRKLLIYEAYPKSFLLDELEGKLPLKAALSLGLDLIDALDELKELGMHHRSICPACVLVDQGPRGYDAYLLDLQMSKIIDSDTTVNAKLISVYDSSNYVPSTLWRQKLERIDWERVDVYAVCKLILFCVDKDLVKANNVGAFQSYPQLWDNEPVCRLYTAIFRNDPTLRSIPTLAKLREALEDASNYCR